MSDGMPYADLVILALIAGFILLRLRSVLGRDVGLQDRPPRMGETIDLRPDEPIVQVAADRAMTPEHAHNPDESFLAAMSDPKLREGIVAVKAADANFTIQGFIAGAKGCGVGCNYLKAQVMTGIGVFWSRVAEAYYHFHICYYTTTY